MRHIFLTVLVILCQCGAPEPPEDLLPPEKMVEVMMNVHLLEAKIDNIPIEPYDSTQAVYDHFEKLLFDSLGISQDQYEQSFNYYVDHPAEFEKIYTAVVDSLMAKEQTFK